MQLKLLAATAFAVLTAPCFAQDYIGFTYNAQVGATSRGSLGNGAGEVMTRIDSDEVAGWGTQTPGFRTISSLFFVAQDQVAQPVANTFDIILYPESTTPGEPDLTAGVTFATGVTGPVNATPGTITAVLKTVTPSSPVAVPIQNGGDVFVAFSLPAVTATSNLSIQICLGYAPSAAFTIFDTPNQSQGISPPPTAAPSNTHFCTRIGTNPTVVHNLRRQHLVDVAHSTAAGRALGITNQTSATGSNNPPPAGFGPAPGTGEFLSGSFPDVGGSNAGRVDDVSFEFFKTGIGTGALVIHIMDIGTFGPEVPVTAFAPGTGVLCLNTLTLSTLGISFTNADESFLVTPLPTTGRAAFIGLPFVQQAAGLDSAGQVHASPCSRQIF